MGALALLAPASGPFCRSTAVRRKGEKSGCHPEPTQVLLSNCEQTHLLQFGSMCCRGFWGMAIYELLRGQGVFAPEEVAMLGNVFEDVLQTLGLVDRKDLTAEMVAKCLVEHAKTGIRDPARLTALTIQAFSRQQQQRQVLDDKWSPHYV
jgi:hypothetical protein